MSKKDFYEILVYPKVQARRDKKRRKVAMQYHPDRAGDKAAEEKFKEAAEAYEVLAIPINVRNMTVLVTGIQPGPWRWRRLQGGGMNMDDIFSQFGDIFGDDNPS
jgi:molecular chaperone DnaJ